MTRLAAAIVLISCVAAQQRSDRVQFDWAKIAATAASKVDVNLEGPTLQMASKFLSNDEKDEFQVKQMIESVKGIYVKSFEFDKEGQYSLADLGQIRSQLRAPEWSQIVDVQEKTEHVGVYMKTDGKQIQGMVVLSAEPTELTFVEIVGAIDPSMLGQLSGKFGIPKMQMGPKPKIDPLKTGPFKKKND